MRSYHSAAKGTNQTSARGSQSASRARPSSPVARSILRSPSPPPLLPKSAKKTPPPVRRPDWLKNTTDVHIPPTEVARRVSRQPERSAVGRAEVHARRTSRRTASEPTNHLPKQEISVKNPRPAHQRGTNSYVEIPALVITRPHRTLATTLSSTSTSSRSSSSISSASSASTPSTLISSASPASTSSTLTVSSSMSPYFPQLLSPRRKPTARDPAYAMDVMPNDNDVEFLHELYRSSRHEVRPQHPTTPQQVPAQPPSLGPRPSPERLLLGGGRIPAKHVYPVRIMEPTQPILPLDSEPLPKNYKYDPGVIKCQSCSAECQCSQCGFSHYRSCFWPFNRCRINWDSILQMFRSRSNAESMKNDCENGGGIDDSDNDSPLNTSSTREHYTETWTHTCWRYCTMFMLFPCFMSVWTLKSLSCWCLRCCDCRKSTDNTIAVTVNCTTATSTMTTITATTVTATTMTTNSIVTTFTANHEEIVVSRDQGIACIENEETDHAAIAMSPPVSSMVRSPSIGPHQLPPIINIQPATGSQRPPSQMRILSPSVESRRRRENSLTQSDDDDDSDASAPPRSAQVTTPPGHPRRRVYRSRLFRFRSLSLSCLSSPKKPRINDRND